MTNSDSLNEKDYTPQKWQEITDGRKKAGYEEAKSDVYNTLVEHKYKDSFLLANEKNLRQTGFLEFSTNFLICRS